MELVLWVLAPVSVAYVVGVLAAAVAWDRGAKVQGWKTEKGTR